MAARITALLIILSHALWACTGQAMWAPTPSPVPTSASPTAASGAAPAEQPGNSPGCYYAWATRELPELGNRLRDKLGSYAGLETSAYAFGEDCRHDDGTTTFLAMETDFRVRIPVPDVGDQDSLGDWIARVMAAVDELPSEEKPGTRPGRVEFEFRDESSASLRLNIEVARYHAEAQGLSGSALLQHFLPTP